MKIFEVPEKTQTILFILVGFFIIPILSFAFAMAIDAKTTNIMESLLFALFCLNIISLLGKKQLKTLCLITEVLDMLLLLFLLFCLILPSLSSYLNKL